MSCNYITIVGGHKVAHPIGSLEEYLNIRNSPGQIMTVQMARSGDERAKLRLAQFNYSGHYPNGVVKGNKLPSLAFGFDLDDPGEFERIKEKLLQASTPRQVSTPLPLPLSEGEGSGNLPLTQSGCDNPISPNPASDENHLTGSLPREGWGGATGGAAGGATGLALTPLGRELGLLMLERSARQGGHAVFRREQGKTILENQVRVAMALGCEMDTNAHDINRVYFTTTGSSEDLLFVSEELFMDGYDEAAVDEEARRLGHREEYHLEVLPEGAHSANKHFRPSPSPAPSTGEGSVCHPLTQFERPSTAVQEGADNRPTVVATPLIPTGGGDQGVGATYLGISYAQIISKWWELYNNGQEPIKSNRDSLTFELAVNLRHICGFDRELMDQVIPCYDGFPQAQKMKCIDSALAERRTQMPARLKTVLAELRKEHADNAQVVAAIDEAELQDDCYFTNCLPKGALPMGVSDSVEAVGPALCLPVITAICPAIGALATGVKLDVHGKLNSLNLIAYICGEFASGKGDIDPVIDAWMKEVDMQDQIYIQQEDEYRTRKRQAKNDKKQPEEPHFPVRFLTLNNTVANLAERLARTQEKHAFSYTPEADTVALKWKSAVSDFSVMIRQAYDASRYDREARSADAVNVHIRNLRWNVTMCGTPDALYRVVTNYTDGFQSRIAIARTPDNTFAPLADNPNTLTDRQSERIGQIAHLLPLMEGSVKLNKLEQQSRKWVEAVRMTAVKNDDRVYARQRMRVCVTAMRMTACLMLCDVCQRLIRQHGLAGAETRLRQDPELWKKVMQRCQTDAMLETYDVIADSLLDNAMFFFHDRITEAYASREFSSQSDRSHHGKNDTIYSRLESVFTFEQAMAISIEVKGNQVTRNAVHQMLKNWRKQGLVVALDAGRYQKVG